MPTYQYTCTDCGAPLEAVQSFSDDALTVCPTCDGRLRKIYSAVGVVFKGSGFYKNDSRPKDTASSAGKDSAPSKDSGTKESTTTATKTDGGGADKPAAKKEPAPAAKSAPSKPAST